MEIRTFTTAEACKEISKIMGLDQPIHANSLLKYRKRNEVNLSPTAKTTYNGNVLLIQKDIDIIITDLKAGLASVAKRKGGGKAPSPVEATGIIKKLETQLSINSEKIEANAASIEEIKTDELAFLYADLERLEETIKEQAQKDIILTAAFDSMQREIRLLQQQSGLTLISGLTEKIDVLNKNLNRNNIKILVDIELVNLIENCQLPKISGLNGPREIIEWYLLNYADMLKKVESLKSENEFEKVFEVRGDDVSNSESE